MTDHLQSFEEWVNQNRPDGWNFDKVLEIDGEPVDAIVMESALEIDGEINLTVDQWKGIKGIGPTLAQRLVESGPYQNLDAIKGVKGISKQTLERIAEAVTISSASSAPSSDDEVSGAESSN